MFAGNADGTTHRANDYTVARVTLAHQGIFGRRAVKHGPRCIVPDLKGLTLARVRDVLGPPPLRCRLGEIAGPKKGVVVKQSPRPGVSLPWLSRIDITLADRGVIAGEAR